MSDKVRVGVVGLGYWGPNLARNFDRLPDAELAYCCDLDEANLAKARSLVPDHRRHRRLAQLLADDALDAVVVATSVPTHYALGKQALEAGKHTFIEKPHRAQGGRRRGPAAPRPTSDGVKLMVGHLLEYHPAVAEMKELHRLRRARRGLLRLRQPAQPRQGADRRERALELRAARHLGAQLPHRRRAGRGQRPRRVLPAGRRRGRRLRLHQVPERRRRPPARELARPAQEPQDHRRRRRRRWSSSTTWRPTARSRSTTRAPRRRAPSSRPTASSSPCASATSTSRKIGNDEPLRLECQHFIDCIRERRAAAQRRPRRAQRGPGARGHGRSACARAAAP